MPIYKPSELKNYLALLGISPRKALSQNFLIDGNIIRKIVSTAQTTADDLVLEIGPGPGSLTEALLNTGAKVIAVEKDTLLAAGLASTYAGLDNFQIISDDILEVNLFDLISKDKKAKVIANLPYNITTPILAKLIPLNSLFSELHVMVQEEVARRFVAKPGTADYSSFTVFLNFYCNPSYSFSVSRHCFFPAPKVDSAVVKLVLKQPPENIDAELFFKLTRTAFSKRRKMLTTTLKPFHSSLNKILTDMKINPKARPEELSFDQWIELYKKLNIICQRDA